MTRLAIALCLLVSLVGCPSAGTVASVESAAIDCASVDVGQTVASVGMTLLADVLTIVSAGSQGWEQVLVQLAEHYGSDALACALHDAETALTAHPPGAQPAASPGASRAAHFAAEHGYRFRK